MPTKKYYNELIRTKMIKLILENHLETLFMCDKK